MLPRDDPEPGPASEPGPPAPVTETLRFPVVYDPPAETTRIGLMLLACVVFSLVGVFLASRANVESGYERQRDKMVAAAVALAGALISVGVVAQRYRMNGRHARGIVLELTPDEVRLWGRGYGTRIAYGAVSRLRFRLVDTFLGRLGAMRQLRVAVEGGGRTIEVASEALTTDRARGLNVEGGEGDCVILDRDYFDAFERALLARLPQQR